MLVSKRFSIFFFSLILGQSIRAQDWTYPGGVMAYYPNNVGIGTNSPGFMLSVQGGYVFQQRITGTNAFAGLQIKSNVSTKQLGIHYGSDDFATNSLRFGRYDLNGEQYGNGWQANPVLFDLDAPDGSFVMDELGQIGIGTLNPKAKLAVNGNILARKVKVTQLDWADYVFQPNYRLRPLSEVEQYIKQYHHLPEVPTAEEVEKSGVDVGDNQVTLLKKIEELTLYVIEQNKKIEEQNQQQAALVQQIKKMQEEMVQLKETRK
jgi:hypothetical protein